MINIYHIKPTYNPHQINGFNFKHPIPQEHIYEYQEAIRSNRLIYQEIVNSFHAEYGYPPFTYKNFLEFFKKYFGFSCTVKKFDKEILSKIDIEIPSNTKAFWRWDNEERTSFTIWINADYPAHTFNATIIHEAIHVLQDFDFSFQEILQKYSLPIQLRIAERITELTAIAVVLPQVMLEYDKLSGLRPHQIAMKYDVSVEMVSYSL